MTTRRHKNDGKETQLSQREKNATESNKNETEVVGNVDSTQSNIFLARLQWRENVFRGCRNVNS